MQQPLRLTINITLPTTNIASEHQWLEDDISFWDPGLFNSGELLVFRERI